MFYLPCKRNSGVSLAAAGVRASKSIAWALPYPGAQQLGGRGGAAAGAAAQYIYIKKNLGLRFSAASYDGFT